jgi:hypothetical protein
MSHTFHDIRALIKQHKYAMHFQYVNIVLTSNKQELIYIYCCR